MSAASLYLYLRALDRSAEWGRTSRIRKRLPPRRRFCLSSGPRLPLLMVYRLRLISGRQWAFTLACQPARRVK
jgi:hypothetical protein